jgi:hypothetical protein
MACVGYSFYLIGKSIQKYRRYESKTTTEYIREAPTAFPAVTFCVLNPFSEYYSFSYMANIAMKLNNDCKSPKDLYVNETLKNIQHSLNLTWINTCRTDVCVNRSVIATLDGFNASWCNITAQELQSIAVDEFAYVLGRNWSLITDFNMTMTDGLAILRWPTTGWFRYMANTCWIGMTISQWLIVNKINGTILTENGNNLASLTKCLQSMNTDQIADLLDKIKRHMANINFTMDQHNYYGFTLSTDLLLSCRFNNLNCYASYTPSPTNNFTFFWNNEYGMCYTFNDGKTSPILYTSESGPNYGLKMSLKTGKIH